MPLNPLKNSKNRSKNYVRLGFVRIFVAFNNSYGIKESIKSWELHGIYDTLC